MQSIAIEKVHRRATKLVYSCKDMSYDDRLHLLNLHSLKGRRLRGDLIEVYKIFNGYTDLDPAVLFVTSNNDITRHSTNKIFLGHTKTMKRKNSFSHRVARHWNSLPDTIKNAKNTNIFKNLLDKNTELKTLFYEYDA